MNIIIQMSTELLAIIKGLYFYNWTILEARAENRLLLGIFESKKKLLLRFPDLYVTMAVFISGLVWSDIQTIVVRCNGLIELNLGNCKLSPSHTWVLIFCVEFWELSHLIRDLSQAEKKMNVVTSWANAQNDIYFTQNGRSCHFVSCSACKTSYFLLSLR